MKKKSAIPKNVKAMAERNKKYTEDRYSVHSTHIVLKLDGKSEIGTLRKEQSLTFDLLKAFD